MFKKLMGLITGIQDKNRKQNADIKAYQEEQRFTKGGGVSPLPATPNPVKPLQQTPLFQKIMGAIFKPQSAQAIQKSVPLPQPSRTIQSPSPTPTPGWVPYKKAYDTFYERRGNPPIAKFSELMAKLTYENPPLRRNPGVLAGVPLLESSGGKNVTFENNPLNWGIQLTKKGQFSPQSVEEVLTKMATGVSGRQKDYTVRQGLNKWRATGNLEDFGDWYAPPEDNAEHGGKVYGSRLKSFDDEIKTLLSELGVK